MEDFIVKEYVVSDKKFNERKAMIADLILNNKMYVPMKTKELAILLQVPQEERHILQEILDVLVMEGTISVSKKGKYRKPSKNIVTGVFEGTRRGFGFVRVEGRADDIFISADNINNAFHLDRVRVLITDEKQYDKKAEGRVTEVLEHQITSVVGTYQKNKSFGFVIPDNRKIPCDIFIPQGNDMDAVNGHKVVALICDYGNAQKNPEGIITEIIGHINDPGTDIMSIVKGYDLPIEFPEEVMKSLRDVPDEISINDCANRMDIRDWQMVTIDGEDAKDLDDAITLTEKDGIYHLGVHIADVSHYVRENSALDKEAYKRGTSVYLVDRVIPMLPHKLSNGICSLNQGCDRLALSCLMDIDEKGNMISHKICETVVNVDRRMTYTNVKKILCHEDKAVTEEYADFVELFERMEKLAAILRQKRYQRGSIDFDFPETKIILDEKGKPLEVKAYERNVATRIIEDFMLIANETVAEEYFWLDMPFLYRSHDNPDPEKMMQLGAFINNFGYSIKIGEEIHPKEIQKLLGKIEGSDEESMIARLTLRSMKRAQYTTECVGHFGLAAKYYCHFTSPIRRYPDLQIHRIIKENLHGGIKEKRQKHYADILPEVAKHTSAMERRADDAERDTDKLKMVEYMEQYIGCDFDGVISGVTAWGIYVELPNTIEGMISVLNLTDGFYDYDSYHYELVNEITGRTFKLGQKVSVTVKNTDRVLRTIDFVLSTGKNKSR